MKIILLTAGFVAGTIPAVALPLGRGELSSSVATTATYDSNVTGSSDGPEDYSGAVTPSVTYLRKAGQIEADARAAIAFTRFVNQTQFDSNNVDAEAGLKTTESEVRHYSGALSAAYRETSDVNPDLNARINTRAATFAGRASLITGARSNLLFDGSYSDAHRSAASDQQNLTTEAAYDYHDFFYGNTLHLVGTYEELKSSGDNVLDAALNQNSYVASAGLAHSFVHNTVHGALNYGYRVLNRSESETSTRQKQQAGTIITATVDGPFLPAKYFPKVTSQFAIAYQDAATPGINDTGTKELTGSFNLGWQARDTTSATFSVQRSQRLSADDLTVVTTDVRAGITQTLRYNLTGTLTGGYDWSSYRAVARQDKTASVNASLSYHFAKAWDAQVSYLYNSTTSTSAKSTFERHLVNLTLSYHL